MSLESVDIIRRVWKNSINRYGFATVETGITVRQNKHWPFNGPVVLYRSVDNDLGEFVTFSFTTFGDNGIAIWGKYRDTRICVTKYKDCKQALTAGIHPHRNSTRRDKKGRFIREAEAA
jgi:hypothetical protein